MQTIHPDSGSGLPQISHKLEKWQWNHNLPAWRHHHHFFCFVFCFFDVIGPSFISISSLVLKLGQFTFIRDWPEIRKSGIPLSEFCPISGDWSKLGIPNMAWASLIKCYWKMQNARVTAFTFSELLTKNQQGGGVELPLFPHPD